MYLLPLASHRPLFTSVAVSACWILGCREYPSIRPLETHCLLPWDRKRSGITFRRCLLIRRFASKLDIFVPVIVADAFLVAVHLDDRHQYSIWVSFAEVYNEKAFDLLDGPTGASSSSASSSFSGGSLGLGLGLGGSRLLPGSTVKRKALSIKSDKSGTGKYISGLREIRVFNAQEARAVLRKGQQSRRVFSTLLNKSSSRSHSIFTIKVIRNVDGREAKDVKSASISSLSIVDLAGSERTSNTGTSGDRLREAGNINKSLMVLGQCMEVLRRNQISKEKGKKVRFKPLESLYVAG